jgi:hypothetical protein
MRNVEGDPDAWHNQFPILIDTDYIRSIGIAWIFKEEGNWKFSPRLTGLQSLFYNAQFFWRLSLPFGLFFGMRLTKTRLFQCGVGWKLNGRLALLFRFQTDASAAAGVTGPNYGQSGGWDYGTH